MGLFLKILFTIICFEMTSYTKKMIKDIKYSLLCNFDRCPKCRDDMCLSVPNDRGWLWRSIDLGRSMSPSGRKARKWKDGKFSLQKRKQATRWLGQLIRTKLRLIRPKVTRGPVLRVLSVPKEVRAANVCQARWVSSLTTATTPAVQWFRESTLRGWSPHGTWSIPVMLWLAW